VSTGADDEQVRSPRGFHQRVRRMTLDDRCPSGDVGVLGQYLLYDPGEHLSGIFCGVVVGGKR
jgi:hypothetical protein